MQHSVGRLVPSQRLFGQVLVGLSKTFHLGEASVESHGWVTGILGHVQVGRTPQLLLDHQRLLQQLQSHNRHNRCHKHTQIDRYFYGNLLWTIQRL